MSGNQRNYRRTNTLGENGGVYIDHTDAVTGSFKAIQALEATVIAELVSTNITGTLTAMPLAAGVTIEGNFTSVDLTSGAVIAYHA
jgi:hypothetical protein